MTDPLLELVEKRMSSLAMDTAAATRQTSKCCLPFTILNMEGSSPVLHLFYVPLDKAVFGAASSEHPKFGVVTMNGCIMVYDTMFRCITWKQQTGLDQVSWGTLSWRKHVDPAIMMHSRHQGFHLVKPLQQNDSTSNNNSNELLSSETHIGFCKPYLCSDQHVIVPIGNDKIGIHRQGDQCIQACHSFKAMLMAVKEIINLDASRYIICATEDGYVHVMEASRNTGGAGDGVFQMKSISKLLLPNYGNDEQQPIGMCIEGDGNIFVIGSNLKYMFLLKWTQDEPKNLQPFGKKILPTEGVSCMAMREGRKILASGCFDGTVRMFGFPEMSQISTINYHKTQINTLLFINEKINKDGRWYLLCGANDYGLSVWNMQSRKID